MDSALLITWAATEAALRWAGQAEEDETPPLHPMELIGSLYADGILDEEDYVFLKRVRDLRNAAVHGFRAETIDREIIDRTQQVALNLINRYASKLAA